MEIKRPETGSQHNEGDVYGLITLENTHNP